MTTKTIETPTIDAIANSDTNDMLQNAKVIDDLQRNRLIAIVEDICNTVDESNASVIAKCLIYSKWIAETFKTVKPDKLSLTIIKSIILEMDWNSADESTYRGLGQLISLGLNVESDDMLIYSPQTKKEKPLVRGVLTVFLSIVRREKWCDHVDCAELLNSKFDELKEVGQKAFEANHPNSAKATRNNVASSDNVEAPEAQTPAELLAGVEGTEVVTIDAELETETIKALSEKTGVNESITADQFDNVCQLQSKLLPSDHKSTVSVYLKTLSDTECKQYLNALLNEFSDVLND